MSTINKDEINKFSKIADEWWDINGKFKPLHMFNPIRIEHILDITLNYFKINKDKKFPLNNLKSSKDLFGSTDVFSFWWGKYRLGGRTSVEPARGACRFDSPDGRTSRRAIKSALAGNHLLDLAKWGSLNPRNTHFAPAKR